MKSPCFSWLLVQSCARYASVARWPAMLTWKCRSQSRWRSFYDPLQNCWAVLTWALPCGFQAEATGMEAGGSLPDSCFFTQTSGRIQIDQPRCQEQNSTGWRGGGGEEQSATQARCLPGGRLVVPEENARQRGWVMTRAGFLACAPSPLAFLWPFLLCIVGRDGRWALADSLYKGCIQLKWETS